MHVLLVSATNAEQVNLDIPQGIQVSRLVHGVGLIESTFSLTATLSDAYDWVIQIGLAGTYNPEIQLGTVVVVEQEIMGINGAEDKDGSLLSVFDLQLAQGDAFPYTQHGLINPYLNQWSLPWPKVKALSVQTSSGYLPTIKQRLALGADIETMEGAAFHYVALQNKIKFLQIRAISNVVEPRHREVWQIPLAMQHLQQATHQLLYLLAK